MKVSIMLLTLIITLPCQAEIYKWTDADGNIHFSDAPHESIESQVTGTQSAPLPGTSSPSGGSVYLLGPSYTPSYNTESSNKEKSRERLSKRAEEKARLRQVCNDAKADVADAKYWRSQFVTAEYRHQYDAKIKASKRREDQACKLSNFR